MLVIEYNKRKRYTRIFFTVTIIAFIFWCIAIIDLFSLSQGELFIGIESQLIPILIFLFVYLIHILGIQQTRFYLDRIEQISWRYKTTIPTSALICDSSGENKIRLIHGLTENKNESITIHLSLLGKKQKQDIEEYLNQKYKLNSEAYRTNPSQKIDQKAKIAFLKAENRYFIYKLILYTFAIIAFFTISVFISNEEQTLFNIEVFYLPQPIWHLLGLIGCIVVYRLLSFVNNRDAQSGKFSAGLIIFISGFTFLFGSVLYDQFGFRPDFYFFALVNYWLIQDFSPRLTQFENTSFYDTQTPSHRPRRSLNISLVLLGSLTTLSGGFFAFSPKYRELQGSPTFRSFPAASQAETVKNQSIRRGGFGGSSANISAGS